MFLCRESLTVWYAIGAPISINLTTKHRQAPNSEIISISSGKAKSYFYENKQERRRYHSNKKLKLKSKLRKTQQTATSGLSKLPSEPAKNLQLTLKKFVVKFPIHLLDICTGPSSFL